jgi:hypothetical protein
VTGWAELFLGVIAAATLVMAVVQVGVILAAANLAKRVDRLADQLEHELKPLFVNVNAIGRDASRAVTLAAAQVERADKLFADVVAKIELTVNTIQAGLVAPAREGRAIFAALSAVVGALRDARRARQGRRSEDEDALFI